jgi:hypothetical protein
MPAGKYLVWLSRQAEETPANKKLANQITRRWAAPLFAAGREDDNEDDAEQQRYIYQQRKLYETEVGCTLVSPRTEVGCTLASPRTEGIQLIRSIVKCACLCLLVCGGLTMNHCSHWQSFMW